MISAELVLKCLFPSLISALVVRFLTKRFIGDYERNAGNYLRDDRHLHAESARPVAEIHCCRCPCREPVLQRGPSRRRSGDHPGPRHPQCGGKTFDSSADRHVVLSSLPAEVRQVKKGGSEGLHCVNTHWWSSAAGCGLQSKCVQKLFSRPPEVEPLALAGLNLPFRLMDV